MNWGLEFSPLLSETLLWGAAALAALVALAVLLRARRGALWRALSLALIVLALANPTLKRETRTPLKNIAVVLIDDSSSQLLAGRPALTEAARARLTKALGKIPDLEVRVVHSHAHSEDGREQTALFAELAGALEDVPRGRLAGIFLITDGQVHDVPANASALGLDAPVHALLTGRKGEYDRHIQVVSAPRFGLVGSSAIAEVRIVATGNAPTASAGDNTAALTIRREGQPAEVKEVAIGDIVRLPFTFAHTGKTYMELALSPGPGELSRANNHAVIEAEGVRDHLRVLLVSGEPHIGERTWRNLLRSDAAVDLVHFTILRPPEKQDGTPINQLSLIAFPTRELFSERLNDFDLIIFDRYQRRGVLPLIYLDNVARYIERGGAVLIAAGPEFASPLSLYHSPLATMLPVRPSGQVITAPFRPTLSADGRKHPVTTGLAGAGDGKNAPAWGRWFRLIGASPERGKVLMRGAEGKPLLVLARQAKGRVAVLLSDDAWLWARGYEGGGPYATLLRRLAHWLMKEPDLEEESLHAHADNTSLTITRHAMGDTPAPVRIETPDGKTLSVRLGAAGPGLWRKRLGKLRPGLYRAHIDGLTALAHVGAGDQPELREIVAVSKPLAPVLKATGGGAFWLRNGVASDADVGASAPGNSASAKATPSPAARVPRVVMMSASSGLFHGSGWAGLRDRHAYVVKAVRFIPLFSGLAALAVLVGLLGLTWLRESR